jgi:hypothetical protein
VGNNAGDTTEGRVPWGQNLSGLSALEGQTRTPMGFNDVMVVLPIRLVKGQTLDLLEPFTSSLLFRSRLTKAR